MAVKQYDLANVGVVKLYKRRNARSIKITVARGNTIRVTLPPWMPYSAGVQFVKSKQSWILDHQKPVEHLTDGMAVGKAHRLRFEIYEFTSKPTSRITDTEVRIVVNSNNQAGHTDVQKIARQACIRALRQEANKLLPIRHKQIAEKYGFDYNEPKIKHLRARWGSCSHKKDITLNLFLMQMPWELIDYVILHELAHTRVLNHGADFWSEMEKYLPNPKDLRKKLKEHQPVF